MEFGAALHASVSGMRRESMLSYMGHGLVQNGQILPSSCLKTAFACILLHLRASKSKKSKNAPPGVGETNLPSWFALLQIPKIRREEGVFEKKYVNSCKQTSVPSFIYFLIAIAAIEIPS